jgi:hypothetical protein
LNEVGKYQFTLIATDSSGNKTTKEYNIEVADRIAPQISLIGSNNITHDVGKEFNDPGVTVTDADKNTITKTLGNVLTNQLGQYTLTYTATDTSGNASETLTRTVNVVDRVAPIFQNYEDNKTYEFVRGFSIPMPTCTDNYDSICTVKVNVPFENNKLGSQTLIYRATDSSFNKQLLTLKVNIVDTTKPTISLVGQSEVILEWKELFVDPGVTYSDNFNEIINVVKTTTEVDSNGFYSYIYSVTDSSGNNNKIERVMYEKKISTLIEVNHFSIFDMAFSTPSGFILVSRHSNSEGLGNEISITNKSLDTITRINLDGDIDFKIFDAKISDDRLYLGGEQIIDSPQIFPPNNAIRIYDFSGKLINEINLPNYVESFDVFDNGDIIYASTILDGTIYRISQTGEVLKSYEFPELLGNRIRTLVASNGNVFFSVANENVFGDGSPGVYLLKANTEELITVLSGKYYNVKEIDNKIFAIGINIVSFDLNGNQIDVSGTLNDRSYVNRLDQPFTNISQFKDGFIVSGFRPEIFYIDRNLKVIWGYQTKSFFGANVSYYSHGLVTDGNRIILSGYMNNQGFDSGDGISTILNYE